MRSRILVFGSSCGLIPGCGYDCDPVVAPGGRGSGPWGSLVGWSGGGVSGLSGADGGQCVQGGQHVVEQPGPVSRWWPQDVPAGGSGEPGGDVDQFSAEPGQRAALASAAVVMPVISWIQLEMAQAINAAHIHTVLTVRSPDGR